MDDKITLRALFDSKINDLEQRMEGLSLPKDNLKIQEIISSYLSELFDSEGAFRQNLTQSEDYLLQATMSLLTAQQEMGNAFLSHKTTFKDVEESTIQSSVSKESPSSSPKKIGDYLSSSVNATQTLAGTGAGAVLGKLVFGGWGAVFGAIAGTAVTVYLAGRNPKPSGHAVEKTTTIRQEIVNDPIDVHAFTSVVGGICDSVDNLISTFRSQVNRVIDKYETMAKPSIEKEYRFLLESIQSLLGYKRTHSPGEEKYEKKLHNRIEDIAECLENYNLSVVDFDGENDYLFEMVSSEEAKEKRMVYPAIVKDSMPVLKGKVFVPGKAE